MRPCGFDLLVSKNALQVHTKGFHVATIEGAVSDLDSAVSDIHIFISSTGDFNIISLVPSSGHTAKVAVTRSTTTSCVQLVSVIGRERALMCGYGDVGVSCVLTLRGLGAHRFTGECDSLFALRDRFPGVVSIEGVVSEIDIFMSPTGEILEVAKVSSQKRSLERTSEQSNDIVKQTLGPHSEAHQGAH